MLERKGLAGCFDPVFGGDEVVHKKPDTLPLPETRAALGSVPPRTLMVGDSGNDALAARAASWPVLLLSHGDNRGEPTAAAGAGRLLNCFHVLGPQTDSTDGRFSRPGSLALASLAQSGLTRSRRPLPPDGPPSDHATSPQRGLRVALPEGPRDDH